MDERTEIQRSVFDFIRDTLVAGLPAPTRREVAAEFGWSSKRAAECHIEALIRKGWLASEPGKARSLRLPDGAEVIRRAIFEIPEILTGLLGEKRDATPSQEAVALGASGADPRLRQR